MIHSIEQLFPLLITFLVGGACGAVVMGPRIAWRRSAASLQLAHPLRQLPEDRSDLLEVSPKVDPAAGLPALRAAALDEAARVYGPAAQLHIERTGPLHLSTATSFAPQLLQATILIRCLSLEEVPAYGA